MQKLFGMAEGAFAYASHPLSERCCGAVDSGSENDLSTAQCLVEAEKKFIFVAQQQNNLLHLGSNQLRHDQQDLVNVHHMEYIYPTYFSLEVSAACHYVYLTC
jgi:hypothetical protein